MKVNLAIPLACIFTCFAMVCSAATAPGDLLVIKQGINIRKENSKSSEIYKVVSKDEVVMRLLGEVENGFIKIKMADGSEAWVYEELAAPIVEKSSKDRNL
jgi:uncharacterized protein YgiM (DUF1202 family)